MRVMRGALRHDCTFMQANMIYRHNRDRVGDVKKTETSLWTSLRETLPHLLLLQVITMGLELQDKAWALHAHRPEFTLTYPLDAAKKASVSESVVKRFCRRINLLKHTHSNLHLCAGR